MKINPQLFAQTATIRPRNTNTYKIFIVLL